jgi:hypothetical protein
LSSSDVMKKQTGRGSDEKKEISKNGSGVALAES